MKECVGNDLPLDISDVILDGSPAKLAVSLINEGTKPYIHNEQSSLFFINLF